MKEKRNSEEKSLMKMKWPNVQFNTVIREESVNQSKKWNNDENERENK